MKHETIDRTQRKRTGMRQKLILPAALAALFLASGCAVSVEAEQTFSATAGTEQQTSTSEETEQAPASEESDSGESGFSPLKDPYIAPDGEALTLEDADYVVDANDIYLPFAYITYVQAGETCDPDDPKTKIQSGDVLDNGLTVTSSRAVIRIADWGYELGESNAAFEGELTLTGTLRCDWEEDPMTLISGLLFFIPDSDQNVMLPFGLSGGWQQYWLGSIYNDDKPEGIMEIFDDGQKDTVRVEVTLKDIRVYEENWKTGNPDSAVLVAVKEI